MQDLLSISQIMNYIFLGIIYILIIQLIYKFYLKDYINLNLYRLVGTSVNNKLEYLLNKIIKLNKQVGIIWIWLSFIILLLGLLFNTYFINHIYVNLESHIDIHNAINNDHNINTIYIYETLKNVLLNLEILYL